MYPMKTAWIGLMPARLADWLALSIWERAQGPDGSRVRWCVQGQVAVYKQAAARTVDCGEPRRALILTSSVVPAQAFAGDAGPGTAAVGG